MSTLLDETRTHGTLSPFGQRGDDSFLIEVPAGEVFDGCALTIVDKRFNAGASIWSQPVDGQAGVVEVGVHWWYDGGAQIGYRIEAFSRNATPAPLHDIVKAFNGFHLDADRIKEIESLQFVPFAFENAAEPVDVNKSLVLVLVETRLLADLTGSSLSAADLALRFATFKADLLREGRQARFLQMTVHSGPPHQDGKTLLAIREFFRAVRGSFANFEGAILVGAFPEAGIVRTWPQKNEQNGQLSYGVGLSPGEPHRFEIVLADLDGNWEHLYQRNIDAEGCTFRVTPATTVSQVGTKVTLVNPQVERDRRHLEDVFWLRDAFYTIAPLPIGGSLVAIDLAGLNPELCAADTGNPNPVARPSICVSRINARSVAVQPPSARLLDSTGKPTQTSTMPPIDLAMEAWPRDARLERRLLVDYFDRNHAFRSGKYSDKKFRVGLIEYDLPPFSVDEGLKDLRGDDPTKFRRRDDVRNADLLDLVRWLKRPILLRAISAHADCRSTRFRPNDAEAQAVEVEAGGKPWRWVEQGSYYVPSFAGHNTGDLHLYRTLWENGQLANVPPSLMLHVGCDVNWPDHCELPYDDSSYGTFQNAESLLFYANQLAVLCHPCWWNRGPMGFGEGFGASSSAVFGDGWKNVSDHIAHDQTLAPQETERKQNYFWSIVGDWTLRKYYPARVRHDR